MKNYYTFLEVPITASQRDIIIASEREKSRIQNEEPEQDKEKKLAEVAEAYTVLSDPISRQKFHRKLMHDIKKRVDGYISKDAWGNALNLLHSIGIGFEWLKRFIGMNSKPLSEADKKLQAEDDKLLSSCYQLHAQAAIKRRDFREAYYHLQKAIILDPLNCAAYEIRSELYFSQRRFTEAYEDYLQVVAMQSPIAGQLLQRITTSRYDRAISTDFVKNLASTFAADNIIPRTLILSNCGLNLQGLEALTSALATNKALTVINFSRNTLGDEGAEMIAKLLEINTTITGVNLSHNRIFNKGFIAFANMLGINRTLTSLNLKFNNLDQTSNQYQALILAVENNYSLSEFATRVQDDKRVDAVLSRNIRLFENWNQVAVITSFVRANCAHPFRYSVLPFTEKNKKPAEQQARDTKVAEKTIQDFMGKCTTTALLNTNGFLSTKYFYKEARETSGTLMRAPKKRKETANDTNLSVSTSLKLTLR